MNKLEKKFGKYAIPNLTLILICCYIAGYLMKLINPSTQFLTFLTLDPERILHGQIWRLFTWLIVPPDTLDFFTIIMLFFYYSIGTSVERTIGTFKYNVYIFTGVFLTIIASFLCYGLTYFFPDTIPETALLYWAINAKDTTDVVSYAALWGSMFFSTYYINICIFLAFAIYYPNMQVLLMFVIPIKVKWMGILDLVLLVYEFFVGNVFQKFAIGAALLNVLIFYLQTKNLYHLRPKQIKRREEFKKQVKIRPVITKHKCAICGQTEETNPNLEFRFCSKCNGNYEYCQEHLFTHEHVK